MFSISTDFLLYVSNGMNLKTVLESPSSSGSYSSAFVAGREKNFTMCLYINSDVYGQSGNTVREASRGHPLSHVCAPMLKRFRMHMYAPVKRVR